MATELKTPDIWRTDDKSLVIPQVNLWRWQALLSGSGWSEGDGPIQGVFKNKNAGHRALWSVTWHTNEGIYRPDDFCPVELLSVPALLAEASDIVQRQEDHLVWQLNSFILDYYNSAPNTKNMEYWRSQVEQLLRQLRPGYKEFCAMWSVPNKIVQANIRPSWGSREELRATLESRMEVMNV